MAGSCHWSWVLSMVKGYWNVKKLDMSAVSQTKAPLLWCGLCCQHVRQCPAATWSWDRWWPCASQLPYSIKFRQKLQIQNRKMDDGRGEQAGQALTTLWCMQWQQSGASPGFYLLRNQHSWPGLLHLESSAKNEQWHFYTSKWKSLSAGIWEAWADR